MSTAAAAPAKSLTMLADAASALEVQQQRNVVAEAIPGMLYVLLIKLKLVKTKIPLTRIWYHTHTHNKAIKGTEFPLIRILVLCVFLKT